MPTGREGGADRRAVRDRACRGSRRCRSCTRRAIPQMADADEVWKRAARSASVRYSALVPNLRGAQRALDAGFTELEAVVSASDTHNRKNVNRSHGGVAGRDRARSSTVAHDRGATCQVIVSTAWGCPYEGDVPVGPGGRGGRAGRRRRGRLGLVRRHHRDGHPGPGAGAGRRVPFGPSGGAALNLHFHNTRGTGLANVLAALELGVADFDASVGGLGGCPYAPGATGNIATEELVHMVEDMGVATGIDLAAMIAAAAEAERHRRPHPALPGAARRPAVQDNRPMTDFPELREPSSGAARPGTTRPPRRAASSSPGSGSPSWSTRAASSRTAGSPTPWPTGCPRTAWSPGPPPSTAGRSR